MEAFAELKSRVDQIARLVTEMHPWTSKLGNAEAQAAVLRALFELTKQVEIIKKHLIVQKNDESALV